jgi:hypothetical protein
MSAIFEMPIESETLYPEHIVQITGCIRKSDQIAWLTCNGWTHLVGIAATLREICGDRP